MLQHTEQADQLLAVPYTTALPAVGGANTRPPPATSKKPTYRYSPGEVLTHITIHNREFLASIMNYRRVFPRFDLCKASF